MMFSVVGRDEVESQCAVGAEMEKGGVCGEGVPSPPKEKFGETPLKDGWGGDHAPPPENYVFLVFKMADFSKT